MPRSVPVLFLACCGLAFAASDVTPVPKVTPVPVTANSYPFLAADHNLEPEDLSKSGYVEDEFLVNGTANVYDWAEDGSLTVKTPNAPYTDRILVRRPKDPAHFSGTVIVELLNPARRFDWAMMWGFSGDYFMHHGDAWVGITMPGAINGLKKFNPARYASLSFANPTPDAVCTITPAGRGRGGRGGPSNIEEGLRWDAISQIGAALKSASASSPMAGFKVERVFMTTQGGDITTYINAIHSHARLENGKPVYDGYMIKNPPAAARISDCSTAPSRTDPRREVHNVDVPVIGVVAQGEVIESLPYRRPDSDDPGGRYRLYEIAGAAHIDKFAYLGFPSFPDQIAAVGSAQGTPAWPFNAKCNPDIPLSDDPLLRYSYDAAFANLDAWVRKGTTPPHATRMQLKNEGSQEVSVAVDGYGNAMGGVRNPFVDVPVATYFTSSPGPGTCAELGHTVSFNKALMDKLYGNRHKYVSKFESSLNKMEKEHFLTEFDAKRMKTALLENQQ